MKKIILLIFLWTIFSSTYSIDLSWCYKKTFKVSAYYSPIAKQTIYYKWNYKAEKKLNWQWIRWASWKKVFNGMLAWSKKYKFWTKIYFPWLWVWQVEDRWSAIVSAWNRWQNYDRIDIWVWKWDKALMRALSFWKHVRVWYVCPKYKKIQVWFDYNKFQVFPNFFQKTIWWIWLFMWRNDAWVKVLQTYLKQLWYFHYKVTWYFWPITKQAVAKFQKDNWIKTKYYGYFWPKTRQKLKDILKKKWLYKSTKLKKTKKKIINKQKTENKKINKELSILKRWLWKWYNTYEVKILQKYLKKLGYYKWKIDWYYNNATLQAVAKFQFKHNIISKQNSYLAWYFWPKTRYIFKKTIKTKFINL